MNQVLVAGGRWSSSRLITWYLIGGLSTLAWLATFMGMKKLVDATSREVGATYIVEIVALAFATGLLQIMILFILRSFFSRKLNTFLWIVYILGYIFLLAISVGFAFGFYWDLLNKDSALEQSIEISIKNTLDALEQGQQQLSNVQKTFDDLRGYSEERAKKEEAEGGTCGGEKKRGDGPKRRLRQSDALLFGEGNKSLNRLSGKFNSDLKGVSDIRRRIEAKDFRQTDTFLDPDKYREFINSLNDKTSSAFRNLREVKDDPQLRDQIAEFEARTNKKSFPNAEGGTFTCPDLTLETKTKSAIGALGKFRILDEPAPIHPGEGSDAIKEAFNRLRTTLVSVAWTGQRPPTPREVLEQPSLRNVSPGLAPEDYIPLAVGLFVDLCILLVSIGGSLTRVTEEGHIFNRVANGIYRTVFEDDPSDRKVRELLQHALFPHNGAYYAAVPFDLNAVSSASAGFGWEAPPPSGDRLANEARFLQHLFAAINREGFVKFVPFWRKKLFRLSEAVIRSKLRKRGSPFASAGSFDLYQFYSRTLPDIMITNTRNEEGGQRGATLAGSSGPAPTPPRPSRPSAPRSSGSRSPANDGADHDDDIAGGM